MINLHQKSTAQVGEIRRPITEISCKEPPFHPGLEYTPPARGHWTIAHTPMLIPDSYMIYLCASACMRGVVLSSLEYEGMDRFSMVILNDRDIFEGNLEQVMLDSVCEIIDSLPKHPPIVMPFTSCIHHFLACDMTYIYKELRSRYPDIDFVECFMIPTIRKGRVNPEEQMQINLYDALEKQPALEKKSVNVIGSNYATDPEGDFCRMLTENGWRIRDLCTTKTYQDYKDMAKSLANIYTLPVAGYSAQKLEKRLGQKAIYLPITCNYQEIRAEMKQLADTLSLRLPDLDAMEAEAEAALGHALDVIGDTPVALDHESMTLFLSLAKLLVEHGFNVQEIYSDYVLPQDQENLEWLQEHAPHIMFCACNNYACRMAERKEAQENGGRYLAIGQKSAYFTGTSHFCNILEYNGWWGYKGICRLADAMVEAYRTESDVPAIIQVKAWGCHVGYENAC